MQVDGAVLARGAGVAMGPVRKRDRLDFRGDVPSMRDLYWHADVLGPKRTLTPVLAFAIEVAYMTGALQALGMAMGGPGDDCRARALVLQQQAAQRLAELRAEKDSIDEYPYSAADQRIRARQQAHGKDKQWRKIDE
jgi:hypothetical protein